MEQKRRAFLKIAGVRDHSRITALNFEYENLETQKKNLSIMKYFMNI